MRGAHRAVKRVFKARALTVGTPTPSPTPGPAIGGVAIGAAGATGSPVEGLKLVAGDDFDTAPTRFSALTPTGRYAAPKLHVGQRDQNGTDFGMYIDPYFRGARSQSPAVLGEDRVTFANSRAIFTASLPSDAIKPFLPTNFTGGRGDASSRPKLLTGSLKSAPHFLLSSQGDWAVEVKCRFAPGVARGYWPSFWTTSFNWPDFQEMDLIEGRKTGGGSAVQSLTNVIGSTADGGGTTFVELDLRTMPTDRDVWALCVKQGNTFRFYDDTAVEGVLALYRTYTDARVARFRGIHDVRIDLAVSSSWDSTTYNAADWPKTFEVDWWRAWTPAAAGDNEATIVTEPVRTTPGGAWTATLPAASTLSGGKAGMEQIVGWYDNADAPGRASAGGAPNRLPGGMAVNLSTRAVTGTVPASEGGRTFLLNSFSFDDGSPAKRVLVPFDVAPAVQGLFAARTVALNGAVSLSLNYEAFHSGNLGAHTYTVASDKSWLTVTGNGTAAVDIAGNAPGAADTAMLTITCTNAVGQTTTVTRAIAAAAGTSFPVVDTFTRTAGQLAGTVGESGSKWFKHPGEGGFISISSAGHIFQSAEINGLHYLDAIPPGANYYVEGDIFVRTAKGSAMVCGRMSATERTFYGAQYTATGIVELIRSVNGTRVSLGSYTTTIPVNTATPLRLVMNGNQLSVMVNGVLRIGPITDDIITEAGLVGARLFPDIGAETISVQLTAIRSAA